MNGLPGLRVSEFAIGDVCGEAMLVRCRGDDGSNEGMNFVSKDWRPGCEHVVVETLDHFCSRKGTERINLLKCDIQGAEAQALKGAAGLLREGRIDTIFPELNWFDQDEHCPASQAIALLNDCGFLFRPPDNLDGWRKDGPWLRELTDVIAFSHGNPQK